MKISAVIPTYNRSEKLIRAISSVLNQTQTVDEIIVVDDGSDLRPKLSLELNRKIVLIQKEKNQGVSAARNTGIKAAKNNWLCFLDSDDEWKTNKIKEQVVDIKNNPDIKIFYTDEEWIKNGVHVIKKHHQLKKSGWIFKPCLKSCFVGASTLLAHKSVFEDVGLFDESLTVCEDYDLWIRLSHKYEFFLNPNELIKKHAGHDDQLSTKYFAMDYYRLLSLIKISKNSTLNTEDYDTVSELILKKTALLLKGAIKHNNSELIEKINALKL